MEEEFYSSLKLVTGEEIFSLICIDENDGDPLIILQSPIIIKMIENRMGTYIKISPWMSIPSDDFYIIKFDKVVTMTEVVDEKIISLYQRYLKDDDEESDNDEVGNKVKISDHMGYIGSVDDARKNLENIFKNI
jgi:hypothetical protein